ncbi:MAG: hypothetical protein KF727_06270 [Microbacteriaceae bacterium]|nr:hypothetical protein [Microbacteriaceae bacterium]
MTRLVRTRVLFAALLASALALIGLPGVAQALPPTADPQFVQVDAGRFSYAVAGVTDDGTVYTWGSAIYGELGEGSAVTWKGTPTAIALPALAAGDRVIQVSVGSNHVLAVTAQGTVLVWGRNGSGQLGLGDTTTRYTPVILPSSSFPGLSGTIVEVSASGADHSMARSSSGQVFAWGWNYFGQVGDNTFVDRSAPVRVVDSGSVGISAGNGCSFSVSSSGVVAAWGFNNDGRLGIGSYSDRRVPTTTSAFPGLAAGDRIVQVSGGDGHALAVSSLGRVYAWGSDGDGQLGSPTDTSGNAPLEVSVPGLGSGETVVQVEAGDYFSVARTTSGRVYTWGGNDYGQLGLNDTSDRDIPVAVTSYPTVLDGAPIAAASAGQTGIVVVSSTGGVYGSGEYGGNVGDDTNPLWPVSTFTNIRLGALSGTASLSAAPVGGVALAANTSGWNAGAVLSYRWQRDGSDIGGATSSSYTPVTADIGHQLRVVVTATAENLSIGSATAAAATVTGAAPDIQTLSLPPATAGVTFSLPVVTTGSGTLTYSGVTMPPGVSIDPSTGVISGTLTGAGGYPVQLKVSSDYGEDTGYFTLNVLPGPVSTLALTPSDSTPTQGDTISMTVIGADAYGNTLGNLTSFSTFTSDVPTDVIVGNQVTFPHASPHTITATTGGVSQSVVIQVTALAVAGGGGLLALTGAATAVGVGYFGFSLLAAGLVLVVARLRMRRASR